MHQSLAVIQKGFEFQLNEIRNNQQAISQCSSGAYLNIDC
jgi:hypothetical protein